MTGIRDAYYCFLKDKKTKTKQKTSYTSSSGRIDPSCSGFCRMPLGKLLMAQRQGKIL